MGSFVAQALIREAVGLIAAAAAAAAAIDDAADRSCLWD